MTNRLALKVSGLAIALASTGRAQTTTLVSVDSSGTQGTRDSRFVSVSYDGRFVAFQSFADNLVSGDTNGKADVFLHDRQSGATERVSVSTAGVQANGDSWDPVVSADGRYVAFWTHSSNLVSGDSNGRADIFVRDRQLGTTTRVSVDSGGAQGDGNSYGPSISADGRFVAFQSDSSNLVVGDTNSATDTFVHDLLGGTTTRVSVGTGGIESDSSSYMSWISGDGRYVEFDSGADNLVAGDTNGGPDVFVHDRQTGTTIRVSVDSNGVEANGPSGQGSLSMDGRLVAFTSDAINLVPGDTNNASDVFVHDLQTGTTRRVSLGAGGAEGNSISGGFVASGRSLALSAGGRFVVFESLADNLVPGDTNGSPDVFVRDLWMDATERVSLTSSGAEGNSDSEYPAISADGRFVAFDSYATNMVPGDTNATYDVFLRDRGDASAFVSFCAGDGSGVACPCGNSGATGHGCDNSAGTGGAALTGAGVANLSADSVQLTSTGERSGALSVVMQGNAAVGPFHFGDGLRCAGGALQRLYVKSAVAGVVVAPQAGDPSISARSATLGDSIPLGATRIYQVYYRDPSASFCPNPSGGTFNVSNAVAIAWGV